MEIFGVLLDTNNAAWKNNPQIIKQPNIISNYPCRNIQYNNCSSDLNILKPSRKTFPNHTY
jgi:hypothetical protein